MRRGARAGVLAGILVAAPLAAGDGETLRYSWSLGGFFGRVARIFLPGRGDGTLTTSEDGRSIQVELDITAPDAAQGEFWRYGAVIDALDGRTLRAWSAYRYRGEDGSKNSDLGARAVIDVASGIVLLRRDPPAEPRDLRIWNDGKIYPVVIQPRGRVLRSIEGRQVVARHFAIRPRRVPDEPLWKGSLDIFLLDDQASTPVEISVERRMARVRLVLEDGS